MAPETGIRCRSCLTWVSSPNRRRRCPQCGEDLDYEPLPALPTQLAREVDLQEPDYPAEARKSDTAPMSEFLAAGSVLLGMAMLVGGAMAQQPLIMMAGFFVMLVVTAGFAILGKNSSLRRTAASSMYWVFPRWQQPPDRDRDR